MGGVRFFCTWIRVQQVLLLPHVGCVCRLLLLLLLLHPEVGVGVAQPMGVLCKRHGRTVGVTTQACACGGRGGCASCCRACCCSCGQMVAHVVVLDVRGCLRRTKMLVGLR